MNDLTYDDYKHAAEFLRKYAVAVESKLYIDMKIEEAHAEIEAALRLADELECVAANMDTISPVDLG